VLQQTTLEEEVHRKELTGQDVALKGGLKRKLIAQKRET
jgi:hypothetical protein